MINNTSITGKKWILKDFNHTDIEYLKDNYLLDEITSRLLSIRKIDKSDIQTFLNYKLNTNWQISFLSNISSNKYKMIPKNNVVQAITFIFLKR